MNLIIVIHKMSSDTPISWNDPSNPDDPQAGYGYIPNDTTKEETFFYHSDHLGSTSYITDDKANITQYDAYLPYGELLVDEHSSSEDLPYCTLSNKSAQLDLQLSLGF